MLTQSEADLLIGLQKRHSEDREHYFPYSSGLYKTIYEFFAYCNIVETPIIREVEVEVPESIFIIHE